MASTNSRLPLEGITGVRLERAVAAPLCAWRLAGQGARTIKVERLGSVQKRRAVTSLTS